MRRYLCSIVLWVQCTFQSSHSVCVCENIMLSALLKMWPYRWHPIYCAKNISDILAICFLMILVSVDLFMQLGTFYATAELSRLHLGRALAAPRSPGSLVLAELAASVGQTGLCDLISWTFFLVDLSPIKLLLKLLLHWPQWCSCPFSVGQLGQAWSTWWECHITEVLKAACISVLAEMLELVGLTARECSIRYIPETYQAMIENHKFHASDNTDN